MFKHTEYAVLFENTSAYAFPPAYKKRGFDLKFLQILNILCHFGVFFLVFYT
jgi:hypothetical protein